MILPDAPSPVGHKKKTPPREKQDGDKKECGCGHDHSPEEEDVNFAHDFMKNILKKSEG